MRLTITAARKEYNQGREILILPTGCTPMNGKATRLTASKSRAMQLLGYDAGFNFFLASFRIVADARHEQRRDRNPYFYTKEG